MVLERTPVFASSFGLFTATNAEASSDSFRFWRKEFD